jgi:secreted trypsin-like serine protease
MSAMGRISARLVSALVLLLLLAAAPAAHAQSPEPRVVGGSETTIEQYPWQAAVVVGQAKATGNAYQRQFCGGSLITASIVLTAAHCVYDSDPDCDPTGGVDVCLPDDPGGEGTKRLDADDVAVVLGVTTLSTATAEDEHAVQDVSYDPGFDPGTFRHDVAYLVLATPVTTGSAIQTIDIAGDDEAPVWAPDVPVDISGWGSTFSGGPTVDSLRAASVPIVGDSTCGSDDVYGTAFDPATMVCAGYPEGGVDSCQGDSGGPLEAPLDGGGYRLVGIASWGFLCAQPDAPGVYTRIAQEAPGGIRDDVVAKVAELETTYLLTPESIVGSGGQPPDRPDSPPTTGNPTPPPTTQPPADTSARSTNPLAKCKRIRDKKKRKRCVTKVKKRLKTA